MEPKIRLAELLLVLNSGHMRHWICEKVGRRDIPAETNLPDLEKTCIDGWLKAWLMEVESVDNACLGSMNWSILPGDHFLNICFLANSRFIVKGCSIDPYFFLSVFNAN